MSEPSKESLREISHLFLSNVRDLASNGMPRPQRTPPAKQQQQQHHQSAATAPGHSLDMTPEEFAQMFGGGPDAHDEQSGDTAGDREMPERGLAPVPPIHAIVGAQLGGKQFDRAKEYARHLASTMELRVGLIEIDTSEFRVLCFDRDGEPAAAAAAPAESETSFDPRRMNEVLEELSWDVQRWILVLPQIRVPEARALLRECPRWVLLSTCDHDGVIACYRTLKGLTDLWPGGATADKPQLSLALLDALENEQAERVGAKLVSVCQQFLNWPVEAEPAVDASQPVAEHLVMCARPTRDKGQLAAAPQWEIVADLIARSKRTVAATPVEPMLFAEPAHDVGETESAVHTEHVAEAATATAAEAHKIPSDFEPVMRSIPMPQQQQPSQSQPPQPTMSISQPSADGGDVTEVIDLPAHAVDAGVAGIIDAILRHCASELVECPIAPPMCPKARLAVGRDRRIVMLAVAGHGLSDLNTIGLAYRWLQENQTLIGMAVPQLSIDTRQAPHLSLLIDQSDSAAETLQPMLQGDHVTVKTYRKLRWGGRTGLLLEAA
jgi:hypothetical protein